MVQVIVRLDKLQGIRDVPPGQCLVGLGVGESGRNDLYLLIELVRGKLAELFKKVSVGRHNIVCG